MTREQILEFQARWMRPAGILAVLGALVFAAGIAIQQIGLEGADSDADQLELFHDHGTKLIAGQIIQALGFALFTAPIYVLYRSASARADRMRGGLLPIALIGPALFLIATVVISFGVKSVADDFVEQKPAIERQARQDFAAQKRSSAPETSPTTTTGSTIPTTTSGATGTTQTTEGEFVDDRVENKAEDLSGDSSAVQIGSGLRLTATLMLVFALIYTPLWAMRTGLLTRFWASVGMALGASLLLVGLLGLMGLVIWFAAVGLMLAGWWPRPLPPAWAAGEAIPWLRPGEGAGPPPGREPAGTVEGSGREVSEPPPAENGEGRSPGGTPGERRKKRKRRR